MIQQIGRYVIKAKLGQGGMATVYSAHDPRFKRDVAIKVLPPAFLDDATFRARFEREAQVIASLEFSGIVPVYDFGEQNGQPYLVMRYMPGGSLADRISKGPFQLPDVLRIFSNLAPALDHVHSHGIIHRDLKPGNILFDQYDVAWISDFGIARINEGSATLTGENIIGTPAYMSPEQAQGMHELDGRSDIYALGAILFQILTGKLPYEATTPMGIILKHITEPVPQLLSVKADLPKALERIISRSMEKDREHRYPTASSMASDLAAVINQLNLDSKDLKPESYSHSPEKPFSPNLDQARAAKAEPSQPVNQPELGVQPQLSQDQDFQAPPPLQQKRIQTNQKPSRRFSPIFLLGGIPLLVILCIGLLAGGWWVYSSYISAPKNSVLANSPANPPDDITKSTETAMIETRFTYQDDFSDPASGWLTYDGDQGKMMYHSGSYQVLVDIPNWIMISRPDHVAVDTIIQVEAYKSGGPDDNIFGAICRYLDDDNFYFLGISSDGYYGIGKLINGEMTLINQDYLNYSDFINQGRTSNLLQANCIGSKLALYANGTLLAEGQDLALTQGGVGLMAGSFDQYGVNILFDNFKMTDLDKP